MAFQPDAFQDNQFGFQIEVIGNLIFISEGDSLVAALNADSRAFDLEGDSLVAAMNADSRVADLEGDSGVTALGS